MFRLTWINIGAVLDRGLGGYLLPYGNTSAQALYVLELWIDHRIQSLTCV